MEKETIVLIEKLATKLGTTSEYLWQILINQALISGIVVFAYFFVILLLGYALYKGHKHFSNDRNDWSYYEKDEALVVPMFIGTILWVVCFLIVFFSLESALYGIFNPEYWALNKVLESLK